MKFSENPADVIMTFGQLKGWPLKKIPRSYLEWAADIENQPVVQLIKLYLEQTKAVPKPPKGIGSTPSLFIAPVEGSGRRVTVRKWKRRGGSSN
jgi:uncharacterized protein (DUF3820 family)